MREMTNLDREVTRHKALGHPVRLRILALLEGGELCVCRVVAVLGLAYSTVSAHLRELRRAGLVDERKEGRWVYHRLPDEPGARAAVEDELARLRDDDRLAADLDLLRRVCCIPAGELCRGDFDLDGLERTFAAAVGHGGRA